MAGNSSGVRKAWDKRKNLVVLDEGKTIQQIADEHKLHVREILQLNGIVEPEQVKAGMKLKLPKVESYSDMIDSDKKALGM